MLYLTHPCNSVFQRLEPRFESRDLRLLRTNHLKQVQWHYKRKGPRAGKKFLAVLFCINICVLESALTV